MARKPETLSEVLQARRKRRRASQRHSDKKASLSKAQRVSTKRLKRLPPGVYDRLRAKLLRTDQTRGEVDLGASTPDQVTVLDELRERYAAIQSRHGRPIENLFDDKKFIDATLPQDIEDFARAVRAAKKAGFLGDCRFAVPSKLGDLVELALPALKAALGWLTTFDDEGRPKHRRLTPPSKAAAKRLREALFEQQITRKVNELRKMKYGPERIRRAVIAELHRARGKDAEAAKSLADHFGGMSPQGWHQKLRTKYG